MCLSLSVSFPSVYALTDSCDLSEFQCVCSVSIPVSILALRIAKTYSQKLFVTNPPFRWCTLRIKWSIKHDKERK